MTISFPPPPWAAAFLAALAETGKSSHAAKRAGISQGTAYARRRRHPDFSQAWEDALEAHGRLAEQRGSARRVPRWFAPFLDALAETSNVSASAGRAGVSNAEVYRMRRENEDFARKWHDALVEGYAHLEMDLLARLRAGEAKDGPKFDNGAALRLLALHRDTMAQEHARRRNLDVLSARALIERKLEDLRQRVLARREAEGETVQ